MQTDVFSVGGIQVVAHAAHASVHTWILLHMNTYVCNSSCVSLYKKKFNQTCMDIVWTFVHLTFVLSGEKTLETEYLFFKSVLNEAGSSLISNF